MPEACECYSILDTSNSDRRSIIHLGSRRELLLMSKSRATAIGYRNPDGTISDAELFEEIMRGVDDTPLRIMSARRVVAMGFTREQAEELFSVKLSDYDAV